MKSSIVYGLGLLAVVAAAPMPDHEGKAPSYEQPSEQPSYEQPSYEQPSEQPSYEQPSEKPSYKPSEGSPEVDDIVVLQYALTLEHLENAFYRDSLAKFREEDFQAAFPDQPDLMKEIKAVAFDEKTHVDFIVKGLTALGQKPVEECVYNFPVTDMKSFMGLASVLEGVGVSAYLGAAGFIADKTVLGQAASIATVEGRHNSILRKAIKQHSVPSPFDTPLAFNSVFSLAAAFIESCPEGNPPLPFKAFPKMTTVTTGEFAEGTDVTFDLDEEVDESKGCPMIAYFVPGSEPLFEPATVMAGDEGRRNRLNCKIPGGISGGQIYAVLTYSQDTADDSTIVAGPAILDTRTVIEEL